MQRHGTPYTTHFTPSGKPILYFLCFFVLFHALSCFSSKFSKKHKKAKSLTCQSAFQGSKESRLPSKVLQLKKYMYIEKAQAHVAYLVVVLGRNHMQIGCIYQENNVGQVLVTSA